MTQETWVQSLDWGDHLEKGMATHSSILAKRTSWTEEPGGLQSMGSKESDTTEWFWEKERESYSLRIGCVKNQIAVTGKCSNSPNQWMTSRK